MRVDDLHQGGLADNHDLGTRQAAHNAFDHRADAEAAHFLVIGKRKMDRHLWSVLQEFGHIGKRESNEALHVAGAASEKFAVAFDNAEGIARPVLPLHRYDIRVARKDDPACLGVVAKRGKQIGFGPLLVHHAPR